QTDWSSPAGDDGRHLHRAVDRDWLRSVGQPAPLASGRLAANPGGERVRAVRYVGERQAVVQERPDPRPKPNEVVIRMKAAGICGSDLHAYRHPRPEVIEAGR